MSKKTGVSLDNNGVKEYQFSKSVKDIIPDLVFNGKEVTIIDYKTGDKKTEHQKQIQNYANALKNMGYRVVETDLIYTKDILRK